MLILYGSGYTWFTVGLSPKENPLVFYVGLGASSSLYIGSIIVAHLTLSPFPSYSTCHYAIFLGIFLSYMTKNQVMSVHIEGACLGAFTMYSLISFYEFMNTVIRQFCDHLNIKCFSLEKPKKK